MNPFQSLGINTVPSKYVFPLPSRFSNQEKRYLLAAHVNWVRALISESQIPSTFPVHEKLTEDEIEAFLIQKRSGPLGPHWMILLLTVVKSPKSTNTFKTLENAAIVPQQSSGGKMTWPQVIDFIGESNFNFMWEQPQISLLHSPEESLSPDVLPLSSKDQRRPYFSTPCVQMEESTYLSKLLRSIYINLEESANRGEELGTERFPVSNLCQALSIVMVPGQSFTVGNDSENWDYFMIFHPSSPYSLHDAVTFSQHKLASTARQMFISYQILQFLRDFQTLELPLGDLGLADFFIDECLYINVVPSITDILEKLKVTVDSSQNMKADPKVISAVKCITRKVRGWKEYEEAVGNNITFTSGQLEPRLIESVIRHWCEGLISNYDYLMFLNYLCGRFCDGNPNYHPVFPWVTDFSHPQGVWRDLTKSKFRLNKGERQLDLMYELGGNVPSLSSRSNNADKPVPHHVTDILSEITYYIYKARRTSKDVLCKFVRPKWVPAEYPVSIMRLQEWTPDECIPEFFDDPSILKSIHDDLPDFQLPKWCSSPEEFIKNHRRLLESDYVSAKLHHWIDLTFGFKLSGSAAVKSKNIYLSLVDSHQHLESHGVLQLFQCAHPPRKSTLRNMRNTISYKDLKRLREQELEESSQDANASDTRAKLWQNINLPKHYDPMGFLNDFEVTMNFFKTHFPYLKDPCVALSGLKDRTDIPHSVQLFGCLLLEIVLPQKIRHSSCIKNIEEKFKFYKSVVKGSMNLVPLFCRRAIQIIFDRESLEFSIPLDISLDLLLLGDRLGPIPFPVYFEELYKMIRTLRNYEKVLSVAAPDDVGLKVRLQELKVKSFSRDLVQLLSSLDNDGINLVLPYVIEMFTNPETRVLAVWNLFGPVARALGKRKAAEQLLYPIFAIYDSDYHSDKHLKLFHRTFLLQLSSCFGLKIFLEHFSIVLIEAIGGWKTSNKNSLHLPKLSLEVNRTEESPSNKKKEPHSLKRADTDSGDSLSASQHVEPEMFVMEPDVSDSEGHDNGNSNVSGMTSSTSTNCMGTTENPPAEPSSTSYPSVFMNEPSCPGSTGSSRNQSPLQPSNKYNKDGTNARSSSISSISGIGSKSVVDVSELCSESIIWLSHRLGPVLTAKYLTKNLLRMLTLCYTDHFDLVEADKGGLLCEGDLHTRKVIDCLLSISDLYGNSFIESQYIPYAIDMINLAKQNLKKMSESQEAALIGVSTMLERIFHYMPDTLLMAQLRDPVVNSILTPLTNLMCSEDASFPSGAIPRALLATKCLGMMNCIRKKIGPDLSLLNLKPLILIICGTYSIIYSENKNIKAELAGAFDSSLAAQIFSNFCDLITGSEYESLIRDLYLRQGLNEQSSASKDGASPTSEKAQEKRRVEQQSSFGSRSFGNRIQVQEVESTTEESEAAIPAKKDTTRHLKGNWHVYWDHEIGRSDCRFNFKQIKLQTFTGHTGAVRCIYALDNENSFLTASKDKTVKLFSLRNQGDENVTSTCQWTYPNHKKAVLSVLFHEPLHIAASTDSMIHIWDPFVGKVIRILDKGAAKTSPICALRPILNTSYFVGAGIDSTIHVVDCRTCASYELKIGIGQASGLIRCMAISDSGQIVGVGHSSGMLSTLDLRNGTLLGSWKAHEGEVLQLLAHRNKYLISSSFDQNLCVWNLDDNRLAFNMKGPTEPVHSLCTHESEMISCTTSNRIGIHCGIDANSDFSSTRLRSDTFKGIVTSMRLLPLNQLLLLGSDTGNVGLLC